MEDHVFKIFAAMLHISIFMWTSEQSESTLSLPFPYYSYIINLLSRVLEGNSIKALFAGQRGGDQRFSTPLHGGDHPFVWTVPRCEEGSTWMVRQKGKTSLSNLITHDGPDVTLTCTFWKTLFPYFALVHCVHNGNKSSYVKCHVWSVTVKHKIRNMNLSIKRFSSCNQVDHDKENNTHMSFV